MAECFKKCRMKERCMLLPVLKAVGKTRAWYGKPSVTQLLKDTRQTYLEITNDYTIDPNNAIASMIGTNSHSLMEGNRPNNYLSEVRLANKYTSGQFDAYDMETKTLIDFKFFGAYRVAKALGKKLVWKANGVWQRGIHKGKTKFEQVAIDGAPRDVLEISEQLSYYKVLMESKGLKVKNIMVQMLVRGGLDKTARGYGLTRMSYPIKLNGISKHWIKIFMKAKYDKLMNALKTKTLPPVCKKRWNDLKCKQYCGVNEFCPYYKEKYQKEVKK
jgi:hypothetical protein